VRPRALLALLSLERAKVVSVDRIVDELWEDLAPRSARHMVEDYVSKLRRTFVDGIVVTKDPARAADALAAELIDHCRGRVIKWSCPRDVHFRGQPPRTRVGRIDFTAVAREDAARRRTRA
jgi:hypothetical protein